LRLPRLNTKKNKTKKYTYVFGGINRQESFSYGELSESENISFDAFPAISAGREEAEPSMSFDNSYEYISAGGGLVAAKFIEGEGLTLSYLDEKKDSALVGTTTFSDAAEGRRYAAKIGKYVVVFPDKLYLDLEKTDQGFIKMEKTVVVPRLTAYINNDSIELTKDDFRTFRTTFKVGDVISITTVWYVGNDRGGSISDKKVIIRDLDWDNYKVIFDPNVFAVQKDNLECDKVTFKTTAPDIKNLTVFGGRVWGSDEEGKIHASKYNDPTVWEYFDLSSADSFALETDTTGEFTASCAMSDHVAFFKEDKIHRITGTKPSNFRHSVIYTNGVKKGADKTLSLKDGIIYYAGADGIYAYGGAESEKISAPLGDFCFSDGASVFYKDIYYISIKNDEKASLYGFDTEKKMWLKDGDKEFKNAFKFLGESLYADEKGEIKKIGDGKDLTRDMSVTFREFSEADGEQKGWSRLYIMARLKKGAKIKAEVDYGFGFEPQGVFTDYNKTVFEVRLAPNRGDKISLRLTASPDTVITRVMREYYVHGSVF